MDRSKRVQSAFAAVIILFVTCAAKADEDYFYTTKPLPGRLVPMYLPCTYQGIQYACFDKDQTQTLFKLELQARYWHEQMQIKTHLLILKDEALDNTMQRITLLTDGHKESEAYIAQLNHDLINEVEAKNKWRAKAENPPMWPVWLGGTCAVLGLGAFLGSLLH